MKTELEELRKSQKESKKIQQKVNLEKEELSSNPFFLFAHCDIETLSQKEEELSHSKLELEQVSTHLRTIEKDMKGNISFFLLLTLKSPVLQYQRRKERENMQR